MKQTFAGHTFGGSTFASGSWTGVGVPLEPTPAVCGTDLLARGMAWLTDQLQAHASQPVIYQRGSTRIAVCASLGESMLKLSDEMGAVRIEWTDQDFMIPKASLVLSGAGALPRRGDKISINDGTSVRTYEVAPYGKEPAWKWCDPFHKMIRIHTKLITTEAV